MIPTASLFSHIHCGFGSKCDRPYCLYFHKEIPVSNVQYEEVAEFKYSQEDVELDGYFKSTNAELKIVQEEGNYADFKYSQEDVELDGYLESANAELKIVQEEGNYDDFNYQSYIEQINRTLVDDFPIYAQVEEQTQTNSGIIPAETISKPVQKPPEKRKHHEYSVLDEKKKKLPLDLGNDEILLNLSATHNQPVKKKPKHEPIPTINTIRMKPLVRKYSISNPPPASKNAKVKTKSATIDSKRTVSKNSFVATLKSEKEVPITTAVKNAPAFEYMPTNVSKDDVGKATPSSYVPTKIFAKESCEIEVKGSRTSHGQSSHSIHKSEMKSIKATPVPKTSSTTNVPRTSSTTNVPKNSSTTNVPKTSSTTNVPKVRFSSKINVLQTLPTTMPSLDIEKELREIEILEKKTRLLREYKQLALDIQEIESKKPSYYDPISIRSLFGDDDDDVQSTSKRKNGANIGK